MYLHFSRKMHFSNKKVQIFFKKLVQIGLLWLVTQLYTRNLTQPYTRKLTQLYTREQLSHTREINSAIQAKSTQPYTRQDICFGHVFDDHMFAVCYDMSTVSRVQACSALGSCRPRAPRCHASVTRFYFAIGHVPRLPVS